MCLLSEPHLIVIFNGGITWKCSFQHVFFYPQGTRHEMYFYLDTEQVTYLGQPWLLLEGQNFLNEYARYKNTEILHWLHKSIL